MSNGCEQLHWNLHSHTTRSTRAFNAIARRPYAAFNNCAYAPLHFKEAAFQVEDNFTQHHHTLDTTTAVAAATTIAIHNKTDSTICFCMLCICVRVWVYVCVGLSYIYIDITTMPLVSCPLPFVRILTAVLWQLEAFAKRARQEGLEVVNMPSSCSDFVSK